MKKRNKKTNMIKYLIILLPILVGCTATQKESKIEGYQIKGQIENGVDSLLIYLSSEAETIDSAYLVNEAFEFTGKVETPMKGFLAIKDSRDQASLWIENEIITFSAKRNNFFDRTITGSKAQEPANKLHLKTLDLQKQIDSLYLVSMDENTDQKDREAAISKFSQLFEQLDQENKQFAHQNPNCYETLYLLNLYHNHWGKEAVAAIFAKTNEQFKATPLGKSIDQLVRLPSKPAVGDQYVDFTLLDRNDKEVSLSAIQSTYTLVEFWASWCGPCRKEHPNLLELYSKYQAKGFTIVGVSLEDSKSKWLKAIQEDQLLWDNLIDLKAFEGDVSAIYQINTIPDNFLLDKDGSILANNIRGEELKAMLENLME